MAAIMDARIDADGLKFEYEAFLGLFGAHFQTVLNKYRLQHTTQFGGITTCSLYKIIGVRFPTGLKKYVVLPRMAITNFITGKMVRSLTANFPTIRANTQMRPDARMYPYQQVIVDYICREKFTPKMADKGVASVVLDLRAGAGKTYVSAGLIARLGVKTLFVTTLNHLAKQARDDFALMLQDPTCVDVMVINSALKLSRNDFAKYSFVIFDEVHTLCSERRREIFWNAQTRYVMGMSATTKHREDGFDAIYYKHLGVPLDAKLIPGFDYQGAVFNLHIKFVKYYGNSAYTKNLKHESTGRPFVHYMYGQFMSDPARMELICSEIDRLYADPVRNIYVFAEERENLQAIMQAYAARHQHNAGDMALYDDKLIGYFVGGLPASDINKIKNTARIVFTTYNLSMTGTSWQKMNAMILATSRKRGMEQLAGRIMRQGSDPSIVRTVVDIVDMKTCLARQMKKRKHAYKTYNPTIEKVTLRKARRQAVVVETDAPVII